MAGTRHVEWLNQNGGRAYPFRENAPLVPSVGGSRLAAEYRIPDWLLLDFVVSVPATSRASEGVHMSSLTVVPGSATAVFSDPDGVAVASVRSSGDGGPVQFTGSGVYDSAVGSVVFGDLPRFFSEYPDGSYTFGPDDAPVETRCVRPSISGVSSIRATDSGDVYSTRRVRGDVSLVAGRNITLRYDPSMNAIWIDAANDTGYSDECDCNGGSETEIRTINGVSARNVTIQGGDCIKVETSNGVIRISDTCSKPCCGCEELSFLSGKSNQIVTALARLEAFSHQLASKVTSLQSTIASNAVARASMGSQGV